MTEKKRDSYHSGKYLIFPLKCTLVLQVVMPSPAWSVTRSLSKETKPRAGQRVKSEELEGCTSPGQHCRQLGEGRRGGRRRGSTGGLSGR